MEKNIPKLDNKVLRSIWDASRHLIERNKLN